MSAGADGRRAERRVDASDVAARMRDLCLRGDVLPQPLLWAYMDLVGGGQLEPVARRRAMCRGLCG